MSRPATFRLDPLWARWYRRALPTYWVFLFVATHLPKLSFGPRAFIWTDKLAHFVAFALLAFLFWRFRQAFGGPITARFVWISTAILLAYSALDEYLQSFVQRSADPVDWALDAAGIVSVLAAMEWRRRKGESVESNRRDPLDSRTANS